MSLKKYNLLHALKQCLGNVHFGKIKILFIIMNRLFEYNIIVILNLKLKKMFDFKQEATLILFE